MSVRLGLGGLRERAYDWPDDRPLFRFAITKKGGRDPANLNQYANLNR
jgi:hypothetical protein